MKHLYITFICALFLTQSFAQLNPDRHTTSPTDGWLSCTETMNPDPANGMSHWILIDILSTQQITTMKLWNHNDPSSLDNGVDLLRIQYSVDKVNWTLIDEVNVPISDGSSFYEGTDIANFNGAAVRYILLTAVSTHGGTCAGFGETRFYLGQAVPVVLESFDGNCEDGDKSLNWSFADVTDFGSVDIEYSTDGKDWSTIYTTTNSNNSGSSANKNEYTDNRLLVGNNHLYRLKMNDTDGDYKFSDIVNISCEVDENDVYVFPNPVRDIINIDIDMITNEDVQYTLKDVLGKTIQTGIFQAKEGNNRFTLNGSELVAGHYFITLEMGSISIEKKIMKVSP